MTPIDTGSSPMPALTVNCSGKDLRLSFVPRPDASVPYGPKLYQIDRKRGELVMIGRAGKSLADFVGTVDITAFDAHHVAGTIKLTAKQVGGGTVKLVGQFDYRCPGYARCAR